MKNHRAGLCIGTILLLSCIGGSRDTNKIVFVKAERITQDSAFLGTGSASMIGKTYLLDVAGFMRHPCSTFRNTDLYNYEQSVHTALVYASFIDYKFFIYLFLFNSIYLSLIRALV
jgi:hypothetical protein